jgi:hypothetical protein
MTELFFDTGESGPGLHALVIGVGGYVHLEGGAGPVIADPLQYGNLGQITSPPRSALAFANWLRKSDRIHWKTEVASIDLLISPEPSDPHPAGPGVTFKNATIDDIRTAFDAWASRCGRDVDNVAMFYFCGHGLQSDEQILLASDFGRYSNHFSGAFAFDSTRDGFLQSPPKTQCFFIDACREVTPGTVENLGGATALPLREARAYAPRRCDHDLSLQSCAAFEAAFAPPEGISYFTTALIRALQGGAASTDEYGEWVIRTDTVGWCVDELMQAESKRLRPTAKGPGLSSAVLLRLAGAPDVKLMLECDPDSALAKATLSYEPIPPTPGTRLERTPPVSATWTPPVKAGFCTISAAFAQNSSAFGDVTRTALVAPPSSWHKLKVTAV